MSPGVIVASFGHGETRITTGSVIAEGHLDLCLEVAPKDLGRVIGEGERTARALRTLLAAAGRKVTCDVRLTITGS